MDYYFDAFRKYAVFSGCATRKQYFMFLLINVFATALLTAIDNGFNVDIFQSLYSLISFVPIISINVRRMHDTGRSGGWFLINFVPLIGQIWYLILTLYPTNLFNNRYKIEMGE